eukprot:COSAG05_NODE_15943_length_357_cov_0.937984_2_plen_76_part_01
MELSLPPTVSGERGADENEVVADLSVLFKSLDPETSAAVELSLVHCEGEPIRSGRRRVAGARPSQPASRSSRPRVR